MHASRDARRRCRCGPWQACERSFLEDLSIFIQRESFCANEKIPAEPNQLIILMQGVATRGGAIIVVGGHWGDVILTSPMLQDTRGAKALSYCEIATLSREALMSTLVGYPVSARTVRTASIKMGVARAMMVISMYARMHAAKQARKKTRQRQRAAVHRAAQEAAQAAADAARQQAEHAAYLAQQMRGDGGDSLHGGFEYGTPFTPYPDPPRRLPFTDNGHGAVLTGAMGAAPGSPLYLQHMQPPPSQLPSAAPVVASGAQSATPGSSPKPRGKKGGRKGVPPGSKSKGGAAGGAAEESGGAIVSSQQADGGADPATSAMQQAMQQAMGTVVQQQLQQGVPSSVIVQQLLEQGVSAAMLPPGLLPGMAPSSPEARLGSPKASFTPVGPKVRPATVLRQMRAMLEEPAERAGGRAGVGMEDIIGMAAAGGAWSDMGALTDGLHPPQGTRSMVSKSCTLERAATAAGGSGHAGAAAAVDLGGPIALAEANRKLDALLASQSETAKQVQRIEAQLGRLDVVAENVARINYTLRRAAESNRAETEANRAPRSGAVGGGRARSRAGTRGFPDDLGA